MTVQMLVRERQTDSYFQVDSSKKKKKNTTTKKQLIHKREEKSRAYKKNE